MSNTIDKAVLDLGKNSNSVTSQKQHSTYYQASKMIELMERKRKMVNLKVAVEDALSKVDKTSKKILTLVFHDGVKSEYISQLLGLSIRTFFRRKAQALNDFAIILEALGYDNEFFETEYFNEKWFMAVYEDSVSKNTETEEELDKHLVKRVFNEVSKINYKYNTYLS